MPIYIHLQFASVSQAFELWKRKVRVGQTWQCQFCQFCQLCLGFCSQVIRDEVAVRTMIDSLNVRFNLSAPHHVEICRVRFGFWQIRHVRLGLPWGPNPFRMSTAPVSNLLPDLKNPSVQIPNRKLGSFIDRMWYWRVLLSSRIWQFWITSLSRWVNRGTHPSYPSYPLYRSPRPSFPSHS